MDLPNVCRYCQSPITPDYYFCPSCGKKLREKLPKFTFFRQVWIYFVSIVLPPSGLWYGIRYLRTSDSLAKKVGIIAIVLTIISLIASILLTIAAVNTATQTINNQLNSPQSGFGN